MNILITGGNGFIGTNFINLVKRVKPKWDITNIDCRTYASNKLHDNLNIDISDTKEVNILTTEKYDYIVNFAAESHVDNSIEDPNIFGTTNIIGTMNMLNLALKNNARYLQVSTDEVYGSLTLDESPFTEEHQICPRSPYSASKASADHFVMAYSETYGLDTVITRCSNNYGEWQHQEKLIPKIINNALNNKKIPVYGDGKNIRDWIHVEDHCKGILKVLELGKTGNTYNIGTDNEMTNNDIVKVILEKMNKPLSLIKYVEDRKGHDFRYAIDSSKIENELGWKPKIKFEDGINETINWFLKDVTRND